MSKTWHLKLLLMLDMSAICAIMRGKWGASMKQLLSVLAVFALTAAGGASALRQPAFEYRHVSGPLGSPSREYECEDDRPCVKLNNSPGSTGCILYDNTIFSQGSGFAWWGFAIGDEVVLAGADCVVTELLIGLCIGSAADPQYVTFKAQIYANDGPDGKPGTLLWDSGLVSRWIPDEQELISFPVPDVRVPGRITFAVDHSVSGPNLAADSYEPPTIGEFVRVWFSTNGGWREPGEPEEMGFPFMARVIAQPCGPSAIEHTNWGRIKSMYR